MAQAAQTRPKGLQEQADALASGELTSAELIDRTLAAIADAEPELNAFRVVRDEQARAEAAAADEKLSAGERLPLLGVPVAIKDDTDIVGEMTTLGCPGAFPVKQQDAGVVKRLRAAGAIIVGKTTCPELAMLPVQDTETFGTTRNPWNLGRTPGGSSGGAAAAVAAGLVPAAIGSDGGGSVRIPAAWTHLVGIKPQSGRISTWPHRELTQGLTVHGPIARTVADAALLLDVATGNEPDEIHKPARPREAFRSAADRRPDPLRVALALKPPFSWFSSELDPEVETATRRIAGLLEGFGHDLFEDELKYRLIGASFIPRAMRGLKDQAYEVPDRKLLDPRVRQNLTLGTLLSGPALKAARAWQPRLERRIGEVFERADVVIAPTTAKPPPDAQALRGLSATATDRLVVGACPYAWPWNALGWPGISVPAGLTNEGLPIGVQLLGPAGSEGLLISLAAQLEREERWHELWPPHAVGAAR